MNDYFQTIPACNWEEDYAHENGNYINKCGDCGFYFKGHKRRVRCKICSGPDWEKLSQKQAPKELPGAYHGCWLEGEMVGYARCMVRKVLPLQAELAELKSEPVGKLEEKDINVLADKAYQEAKGENINFWSIPDDDPEVKYWKEVWIKGYKAGRGSLQNAVKSNKSHPSKPPHHGGNPKGYTPFA